MASRRKNNQRQLHSAFAAAHGISIVVSGENGSKANEKASHNDNSQTNDRSMSSAAVALTRLKQSIEIARKSGKLNASNIGLSAPLSDVLFDLQSGEVKVNLSMDSSAPAPWEMHTQDTLTLVDLSDNSIGGTLDDRIGCYRSVISLRLKRCEVQAIPLDALESLEHLQILDLGSNQLTSLPLSRLSKSLREVDLSSNRITMLDDYTDGDVELPNLVKLNVSNNRIQELPCNLKCPRLQVLQCERNQISEFPQPFLHGISNAVTTLEAAHNRIHQAPDLSDCNRLLILDLSNNQLQQPPCVTLTLVRLSLNGNQLESLDGLFFDTMNSLDDPSQLVELQLRDNRLPELRTNIAQRLLHLKLLDIRNNNLTQLPPVLGYLPHIRQFLLDGNPLRTLGSVDTRNTEALQSLLRKRGPRPVGEGYLQSQDWGEAEPFRQEPKSTAPSFKDYRTNTTRPLSSVLVGSRALALDGMQLKELPRSLLEELKRSKVADRIMTLKVSQNELDCISDDWLVLLRNLSVLDAGTNKLTQLPFALGALPLTSLLLPRNLLTSQSLRSSALASLERTNIRVSLGHLDLSSNKLEWIPASLSELCCLHTLNLSNNMLERLSLTSDDRGWKPGFPSLEVLDLSDNRINDLGDLPLALAAGCKRFTTLFLHNNNLDTIPATLGMLKGLQHLDLRGNPQRAIRSGILEQSCDSQLEYLFNRLTPAQIDEFQRRRDEIANLMTYTIETPEAISGDKMKDSEGNVPLHQANSVLLREIQQEIDSLTLQLNNVHLSEAKKYAMKKTLAMQKAKLIREERRIKEEAQK